jgi:hypothetical protein
LQKILISLNKPQHYKYLFNIWLWQNKDKLEKLAKQEGLLDLAEAKKA